MKGVRRNSAKNLEVDPTRRFEAIFTSHHGRVLAYALRRSADRGTAEDAAAETFAIAWRRLDAVPADPLPWLLQTARRVLANQRRSDKRRAPDGPSVPISSLSQPDPAVGIADRVAERDAFAHGFEALSPPDREILTLVAWDGLRPAEAAKVIGCTAPVFSLRLHRARRRLMKELGIRGHSFFDGSTAVARPTRREGVRGQ
jgi:RNA polymerase sigma-70 factor (ECF subfamily)